MDERADIAAQLARRRAAVKAAWSLSDEIVVIGAGDLISVPGRADITYPYRAHSEYLYLTDRNRPGGVLAFDPGEGWVDFVVPVTEDERVWSGAPSGAVEGPSVDELGTWLAARGGRPLACLGVAPAGLSADPELGETLRFGMNAVRRPKDAVELERMRRAAEATRAAFAAVVPFLRPGVSEREAEIEFEAEARRRGGDRMGYDTIVGGGPNSAVLHFPPSQRRFEDGDLVLIDAGAEVDGYVSDVTRTFPVGGELRGAQRELHALVRQAELDCIERCTVGTEWRDIHLTAARVIASGLADLGILRGEADPLIESGASALFFPHGVGHLVGLGVRDAAGPLPERRDDPAPYPNLRIDLPLEAGMAVTVEPGIYFIPALLEDPEQRRRHRGTVDWDRVDGMLSFGGIRIEDNVVIAESGPPAVLTDAIPLLG